MVDSSEVSIMIAAIGVISGVLFAMIQLRNLVKARRMDLVMRLYLAWGEEGMKTAFARVMAIKVDSYEEFTRMHGSFADPNRGQIWTDIDRVCWFANGYCFLVYKGLANAEDIYDLFGHGIPILWEKTHLIVEGLRGDLKSPQSYRWIEYMYNQMKSAAG
jgi:hypothetical protein